MNAAVKLFAENFTTLATSSEGIAKLRELILQLAVQGKLVPQNPNDEPASVLLEKIEREKNKLIKEGKLKKENPLPSIKDEEVPFGLPKGWQWARLGGITKKIGSGSTPRGGKSVYVDDGIKFLRSQNVYNDGLRLDDVAYITPNVHMKMSGTAISAGDILLNITGASIARSCLVPDNFEDGNVSQHVSIIRPVDDQIRHYLHKCIISPYIYNLIMNVQVGMSREGLSKNKLQYFTIPMPPLAEQKRIVAKVDQLMALCDTLEQQLQQCQDTHRQLNDSAIHHLLTAQSEKEFAKNWKLICDNFSLLYNDSEAVEKLRQAILQLAVQGKLVPQDPKDEPAEKLLEKIQAEKAKLIKEGKLKKENPLPQITDDEIPFELPHGWQWTRFSDITICRDSERIPLSKTQREDRKGDYDYYGASGIIDHIDDYLFDKPLLLIGEDGANLINRSTPIAFIAKGKYWVNNHAHVLDGLNYDVLRFIELHINAIDLKPYVTGTAQPKMNQAKMNSILIALPPESEQKRIVAKVDKLMALCDQLQEQIESARTQAQQLAASTIHHLLAG